MRIHIVRRGETIKSIAEKYDLSFQEVVRMNKQIADPYELMQGMKLRVPIQRDKQPEEPTPDEAPKHNNPTEGLVESQELMKDQLSRLEPPERAADYLPNIQEDEHVWGYQSMESHDYPYKNLEEYSPITQPLYTDMTFLHDTYYPAQQQPMVYYNPCMGYVYSF
ncbi:LysM domain-containing protein [Allobacillus sp. GCM10007491]|uniref:LysM peptidoglycan-binding domain-containing protein n=1 Tax=Allobacillus saliphilus TaxID=2912308 RepID=A0A941CT28_9BACI|nr:LysM domain-containing protein [Allobacillus saliphilus]MBR7553408.1 LysM peptidoglycan-binding domain-containing protein [Allobacillus saliphilus]